MAATYPLVIVTPNETVFGDNVESIVAPGSEGYLGILAHHAPLLTALTEGKLKICQANGETFFFNVHGGILEVCEGGGTTILADGIEKE